MTKARSIRRALARSVSRFSPIMIAPPGAAPPSAVQKILGSGLPIMEISVSGTAARTMAMSASVSISGAAPPPVSRPDRHARDTRGIDRGPDAGHQRGFYLRVATNQHKELVRSPVVALAEIHRKAVFCHAPDCRTVRHRGGPLRPAIRSIGVVCRLSPETICAQLLGCRQ